MRMHDSVVKSLLSALLVSVAASSHAGGFDAGATRGSLVLGSGAAFGKNYTVLGGGIDYMINDYVHAGINAQFWRGSDPVITKVSPHLGVVMGGGGFRPYAGVFYRKTWIEDFKNLASVGGRAGVWLSQGRGMHLGVGYVFESYLDCDTTTFNKCDDSYPELTLSFSFGSR